MRFMGDPGADEYGNDGSMTYRSNYVSPPIMPVDVTFDPVTPQKAVVDESAIMLPPPPMPFVTMSSTQPPVNPSGSAVGAATLAPYVDPSIPSEVDRGESQDFAFLRNATVQTIDSVGDVGPATAYTGPLPVTPVGMPAYMIPAVEYINSPASSTMGDAPIHDDQVSIYPSESPAVYVDGLNRRFGKTYRPGLDDTWLDFSGINDDPLNLGTQDSMYGPLPFSTRVMDPQQIASLPAQPTNPSVNENTNGVPRNIPISGGGGDSGKQYGQRSVDDSINRNYAQPTNKDLVPVNPNNNNTGTSSSNPVTSLVASIPSTIKNLISAIPTPDRILGSSSFNPIANAVQKTSGVAAQPQVNTTQANALTAPNATAISKTVTANQFMVAIVVAVLAAIAAHFILKKVRV